MAINLTAANRIDDRFAALRAEGRKAFVAYITAGDPTPEHTAEFVFALERGGADIIELGVPFSDPLADGVVNQLAAQRALQAGTTLRKVLDIVRFVRLTSQVPLVLFTYLNPLMRYGLAAFMQDAQEAGVDGALILDLPPEEDLEDVVKGCLPRIQLVAPTTPPERMTLIARRASGFVYYVSREGVTGMQAGIARSVPDQVERLRAATKIPICVGFGVSNPEQAKEVAAMADGVVVGSAIVSRIAEWGQQPEAATRLEEFTAGFARAIHGVNA